MTGGEIVPVSAAALKAARKALETDKAQQAQLRELAQDSPEMKLAAQQYAKRIAVKQTILLKLFQPLAMWAGVSKSYFETDFADDMAEKISHIPDESLIAPPPSVAVPAMQGLGYSLDEPDLKEMYLNLLATASDERAQDSAHPSFAEIIRQLSGKEARELTDMLKADGHPVIRVSRQKVGEQGRISVFPLCVEYLNDVTGAREYLPAMELWLQNWARLGLIEIDFGRFLTAPGSYDWIEERPEIVSVREILSENEVLTFDQGVISRTRFGHAFLTAVGGSA